MWTILGHIYPYMDIYGPYKVIYVNIWSYMSIYGEVWLLVGKTRKYLVVFGANVLPTWLGIGDGKKTIPQTVVFFFI